MHIAVVINVNFLVAVAVVIKVGLAVPLVGPLYILCRLLEVIQGNAAEVPINEISYVCVSL